MKLDPFISLISIISSISVSPLLIGLATQPPLMETSSELMLTNLNSSQPEIASAKPVLSGIHLIWLCSSLVDMRRTKWSLLGWSRKWREVRVSPRPACEETERQKEREHKDHTLVCTAVTCGKRYMNLKDVNNYFTVTQWIIRRDNTCRAAASLKCTYNAYLRCSSVSLKHRWHSLFTWLTNIYLHIISLFPFSSMLHVSPPLSSPSSV